MNDTNNKLLAIDQTFEQINERLEELEEEQAELRDFQDADREKRALEYTPLPSRARRDQPSLS